MFKIDLERKFRWRVAFAWPNEDGEPEERSLVAVFRRLPAQEWAKRLAAVAAAEGDPVALTRLVADALDAAFADFDEVEFEGGDRDAARAALAEDLAGPLFRAYCDAMGGGLRAKNSAAPPSEPAA